MKLEHGITPRENALFFLRIFGLNLLGTLLLVNPKTKQEANCAHSTLSTRQFKGCLSLCALPVHVIPCDLPVRSKPMPSSPHMLSNQQSQVSAMLRILNAILTMDNMEAVTQACDSNNVRPMSLQSCQMLFGLSEHQHLVAVFLRRCTRKQSWID